MAQSVSAQVFHNPRAGGPYTEAMTAILNDEGLAQARDTITGWPGYAQTPLVALPGLAAHLGLQQLLFKDEGGRFGLGSFKALGGAYAVARLLIARITAQEGRPPDRTALLAGAYREAARGLTVTCATDGNHGRSVAWGAKLFGCPCVIFIHATVSEGRKRAIEAFGAQVVRTPGTYDDSVRAAEAAAQAKGWQVVSDTSYPGYRDVPRDVMQGYELMAEEALAQAQAFGEAPTHILLQTGVGGMAAAVAALFWRRMGADKPKIILVDPEKADCWFRSLSAGKPVVAPGALDTLMAGLACGEVSELAWEILKTGADAVVRLPDEAAVAAMRVLAQTPYGDRPLVAGESAVAGLGALLALAGTPQATALGLDGNARVLLFGTEGDTDPDLYARLVGESGGAVRVRAARYGADP